MIKQSDLARRLAAKHNLKIKNVKIFLNAFVEIINYGLSTDQSVKIKGLGSFKIITVKDRESVDVVTGQKTIIEGHDKIAFTPDAIMKALVNKPFENFEMVAVKEGVSFNDTAEEIEENDIEQETEQEVENITTDVILPEVENAIEDDSQEEEVNEEEPKEFNINEDTNLDVDSELPVDKEEEIVSFVEQKQSETDLAIPEEKTVTERPSSWFSKFLIPFACLLIGIGIGYVLKSQITTNSPKVIYVEEKDSLNDDFEYDNRAESNKGDSLTKTNRPTTANVASNNVSSGKIVDFDSLQSQYEAKYSEIKYGAYKIVGIDKEVTVKKGQTLASISKGHLGPGMQCYVVAVNDGIKEVKEGQTLKIPQIKVKKSFSSRKH